MVTCGAIGWWLEGGSATSWLAAHIPRQQITKDRQNRRGIEALMARLEAELGQHRPQKKSESLEIFFATNKLRRKKGERITGDITWFEEGIKFLQDHEIDWLSIEDVQGWTLMRTASLTQDPDEHIMINDVQRVLVRVSPELHINEHRQVDGQTRRPCWILVEVSHTSILECSDTWSRMADVVSVDDEQDVRNELGALSSGLDIFQRFVKYSSL